jgi:hypothetical protein
MLRYIKHIFSEKTQQKMFHYCRFGLFPVKQHHRSQAASTHQCGACVHPPAVIQHTNLPGSWNTDKPTWIQQLLLQVGTRTLYILMGQCQEMNNLFEGLLKIKSGLCIGADCFKYLCILMV